MTTSVMTLSEYAEVLTELAEDWDGDEPIVLIGDRHGNINISAKDGFAKHGSVGYASEVFEDNGVHSLSKGDTRFYGAMLFDPDDLDPETVEQATEADWTAPEDGEPA